MKKAIPAKCVWCSKLNNPCGKTASQKAHCDFRTLEYTKEAILQRLRNESNKVKLIRGELIKTDLKPIAMRKKFAEMLDLVMGMQLMAGALKKDFSMTDDQIKAEIIIEPITTMQKMKLLMMAQKAKNGGK